MNDLRKYGWDYVKELGRHWWVVMTAIVIATLELIQFFYREFEVPDLLTVYVPAVIMAYVGFRIYADVRRRTVENPIRDVALQDAIYYAVYRRWPGTQEEVSWKDGDLEKMTEALHQIRQLVREGTATIWGTPSDHSSSVYEPIPKDFWRHNEFHELGAGLMMRIKTQDDGTAHEKAQPFHKLMVSKSQIENQWPPLKKKIIFQKPWKIIETSK